MLVLRLETLDRMCLGIGGNEHGSLKYNVPCDILGLPYLPLYALLQNRMEFPEGLRLGLGRPEYYEGLIAGTRILRGYEEFSPQLVLDCFTEICSSSRGEKCRVLKKGLRFFARLDLEETQLDSFRDALEAVTTLGYTDANIPGRVSITVLHTSPEKTQKVLTAPELLPGKQYSRLIYQIQTVSPLSVSSPFDAGSKCRNYLPGEVMMDFIRDHIGDSYDGDFESGSLRVSNAYPVAEDKRGIPAPSCMVLHKLNKAAMEYQLATRPADLEFNAITTMNGQFVARPTEKTVLRFSPEEVKIFPQQPGTGLAGKDAECSAIAEGQVFQGFINGSDRQIRALVRMFAQHPVLSLGDFTTEGYGEVLFRFLRLQETTEAPEQLAKEFDVFCVAPVVLYDDRGMVRYDAESLKQAVEKRLDAVGRLELRGGYMQSDICYRVDRCLQKDTAQVLGIQMGSAIRLHTRDGNPVNIAPMNHGFLGDRRRVGYGEVIVIPAYEDYQRSCKEVEPEFYSLSVPGSIREIQNVAQFIQEVLRSILKMKITMLALSDRRDHPIDPAESMEILKTMRDRYASTVSDEELLKLYREVLERDA